MGESVAESSIADAPQDQAQAQNSFRRKRKAGKFSQFRKFGKQGKLGRGYEINSETYSYFLRVYELCNKNEFDTPEEKELFIDNAFAQTETEEIHLASNQFTSRVLECLFASTSNKENLLKFATSFTSSLRTICTDPYASHVLEKLCEIISEKWYEDKALAKWFRNTSKFILNNYEDFVFDKYANHIMRKICQCLSGTMNIFTTKTALSNASVNRLIIPMIIEPQTNQEDLEENQSLKKFRKKSKKILKGFATQFLNWPQFYDMFENEITSAFVQCLIITLSQVDQSLLNQGVRQVAYTVSSPLDLSSMSKAHMVEVCLTVSTEHTEMFQYIFDKFYKGNMLKFAADPAGHYSIERLFYSAPNSEILEPIFDELSEHLPQIYESGKLSVFRAIADSCRRLKTRQAQFIQKLDFLIELDPTSNTNFFDTLLRFGKANLTVDSAVKNFRTEIHGCYVLQSILEFHKPVKVISSILEYDDSKLAKVAQDPKGSHVIEAFFKSQTVGEKNKDKVLYKLKEYLVEMSCSKFGGRVMDTLFVVCNLKQKSLIASALSPRESQLGSNSFGKFIAIKYGLFLFKRDEKEWARIMSEGKKRKAILDEFITDFGLKDLQTDSGSGISKKKQKKSKRIEEENSDDPTRVPA